MDGSQVYTPVYSKNEKLYVGYHCDKSILLRYTDSDFQSNNDSYKSNFGFVFTLDGGAISWRSVVWSCIAYSIMEFEYFATFEAINEVIFLIVSHRT